MRAVSMTFPFLRCTGLKTSWKTSWDKRMRATAVAVLLVASFCKQSPRLASLSDRLMQKASCAYLHSGSKATRRPSVQPNHRNCPYWGEEPPHGQFRPSAQVSKRTASSTQCGEHPCHTMRFGSTAKVLLKCKLKYYRISECVIFNKDDCPSQAQDCLHLSAPCMADIE